MIPRPNENFIDQKNRADRFERELEKFHKWMVDNGYKINTARNYCSAVLQLFRYYSMPIRLRTGSPISRITISTDDFNLKPKHVRAMFHSAKDLRSKLLISMGNDLGWGISDVIKIRRDELPDLNQTPPIYWERTRGKTKQIAKTCLSETTAMLLKEYLFSFPTDNPYLFHSNGFHISDVTVNQRLRDLARDADIKIGNKRLHWHLFRKMIISQAKNLGIDPDTIKVMVGKAVPKSLLTYMTDINIIEAFKILQTVTRINGELIKPESENQLVALGKTVADMQEAMVEQQKEIKNMNEMLNYLIPRKVTRNILNEDNKVVSWEETFETHEEYVQSERDFRRMIAKAYSKQRDEEFREYIKSKHPKIEDFLKSVERQTKKPRPKDS